MGNSCGFEDWAVCHLGPGADWCCLGPDLWLLWPHAGCTDYAGDGRLHGGSDCAGHYDDAGVLRARLLRTLS